MIKKHTITVYGRPKAKGRPRAGKYGMYTDKKTKEAEANIRDAYVKSGRT